MIKVRKKLIIILFVTILVLIGLLVFLNKNNYIDSDNSYEMIWKEKGFSQEQILALSNAKEYIDSSNFYQKSKIDYSIVSFYNMNSDQFNLVQWTNESEKTEFDKNDIVIKLGSSKEHDFAEIVVNHETFNVIGYLPIK